MEKQDFSNPNIDWAGLNRHVARDQVTVEIADGKIPIARLVPMKKLVSMKDFASMMSSLPSLGEDGELFLHDVEAVRKGFREVSDPWES